MRRRGDEHCTVRQIAPMACSGQSAATGIVTASPDSLFCENAVCTSKVRRYQRTGLSLATSRLCNFFLCPHLRGRATQMLA